MTEQRMRGRAFVGGALHEDVAVAWSGGTITEVDTAPGRDGSSRVEGLIVPGFVDLHVHGAAGADFMDGTHEAVRRIVELHARHGTTALAATTLSGSSKAISAAVGAIAEVAAAPAPGEAEIAAIHLEGPYLHPDKAGAQDRASLRSADIAEVEGWLAHAPTMRWMMTVAPEVPKVPELMQRLRHRVIFSIGHTTASYGLALEAVQGGATHFTHLFNAMPPLHHRDPGPVGAALASEETTAELIADGIHVHPLLLRLACQLMPGRIALVTDAMRACGMAEGLYRLYEHEVHVKGGAARLGDGTLAGSVLTMIGAVRSMVRRARLPLEQVLPLATEVPARVLGLEGRKGSLRVGADADLLVLSDELEVRHAFVRGVEQELLAP
jgi:N-acetylglucosamine-6-phosphate deacetylase